MAMRHRSAVTAAKPQRVSGFHAHGCIRCRRRYMDACTDSTRNAACKTCRTGEPPARWDANRLPHRCCRTAGQLMIDRDEVARYSLGGPGPWWICRTCQRTHPYDPTKETL